MRILKREARDRARKASQDAKYRRKSYRDNRLPETKGTAPGSTVNCWCGKPSGHDWKGKKEGAPHPR